jgi:hypothetical protein
MNEHLLAPWPQRQTWPLLLEQANIEDDHEPFR